MPTRMAGYGSPRNGSGVISYDVYKVLHLLGVAMVIVGIAGNGVGVAVGGPERSHSVHRQLRALHGVGWLIVITAGFGLLARLGVDHREIYPGWVWLKLMIWLVAGALFTVPHRRPRLAVPLVLSLPLLVGLAAFVARYKPL